MHHHTVDEFRARAEPVYRRDPIAHTIELTLLHAGDLPADALLLTVEDGSGVIGAAMQTPPYPLVCNGIPAAAIEPLVRYVHRVRPQLSGVRGLRDTALAVAKVWQSHTGRPWRVGVEERLYRLVDLQPPRQVDGTARAATTADRELVVDWIGRFFDEAFASVHNDGGVEFVDTADRVGHRFLLWEALGEPVSMAMLRVPAARTARIGPVFTPADRRGRGYGSAVTAAAAEVGLRDGVDDIVLFADLANPVANSIYRRIGFAGVLDSVRIDFGTLD